MVAFAVIISVMMVITGSLNTICAKWADSIKAEGVPFNHSFLQATCMFFGEFLCLVVFFLIFGYKRYVWNRSNVQGELNLSVMKISINAFSRRKRQYHGDNHRREADSASIQSLPLLPTSSLRYPRNIYHVYWTQFDHRFKFPNASWSCYHLHRSSFRWYAQRTDQTIQMVRHALRYARTCDCWSH